MTMIDVRRDFTILGVGVVFLMAPVLVGAYWIGLLTQALIFGGVAAGLGLLVGYAGLPSLGHAAFFGLAAYGTAIFTTKSGMDPMSAALVAVAGTTIIAAAIAPFLTRLRGLGFITVTLAFGQVLWGIALRGGSLTGGENGIVGIPRPKFIWDLLATATGFYIATVVAVFAGLLVISHIAHSPFGLSLLGIRDGEQRMTALGYGVNIRRSVAFTIAATTGAAFGVWFAFFNQFIGPSALDWKQSAAFLLAVVIGGRASLWGPFAAGMLLTVVETILTGQTNLWPMVLGILYVITVLLIPDGIVSVRGRLQTLKTARSGQTS